MSLEQIVDNTRTDKNTTHSYLPLYESLFKNKKETAQTILESGAMLFSFATEGFLGWVFLGLVQRP